MWNRVVLAFAWVLLFVSSGKAADDFPFGLQNLHFGMTSEAAAQVTPVSPLYWKDCSFNVSLFFAGPALESVLLAGSASPACMAEVQRELEARYGTSQKSDIKTFAVCGQRGGEKFGEQRYWANTQVGVTYTEKRGLGNARYAQSPGMLSISLYSAHINENVVASSGTIRPLGQTILGRSHMALRLPDVLGWQRLEPTLQPEGQDIFSLRRGEFSVMEGWALAKTDGEPPHTLQEFSYSEWIKIRGETQKCADITDADGEIFSVYAWTSPTGASEVSAFGQSGRNFVQLTLRTSNLMALNRQYGDFVSMVRQFHYVDPSR